MNIILFEDQFSCYLEPFSQMHATFEIRCGKFTNLERLLNLLEPTDSLIMIVRDCIKNLIKERFPNAIVNPPEISAGLWLNGATVWDKYNLQKIKSGHSFGRDDILFGFMSNDTILFNEKENLLNQMKSVITKLDVNHIFYLWDTIKLNHRQIIDDFNNNSRRFKCTIHPSVVLVEEDKISIGNNSNISGGCVLDASIGPIIIGNRVNIAIGCLVQGPIVIGSDSIINPGSKLRGNVVIGPVCRIGGELEDSVIHGYSNKQHDGFLGHSYIGEWVNIGANTNTSDLKNTYGCITFHFKDISVETNEMFIGSMVGDYVRMGISTMLNTGSNIGTGSCLFGSGFQNKLVAPFTWEKESRQKFEPFIKSVDKIKKRRKMQLEVAEKERLFVLYNSK